LSNTVTLVTNLLKYRLLLKRKLVALAKVFFLKASWMNH
jgi:hypothetical protein